MWAGTFRSWTSRRWREGRTSSGVVTASLCTCKLFFMKGSPDDILMFYFKLFRSDFVWLVALVELLQERRCRSFSVGLRSSVVLESVDTMVIQSTLGRHQVFVQVASLTVMELSVMQHLVSKVHQVVDSHQICDLSITSEMISDVDLCLFGSSSVLASWRHLYISWIFRR